MDEIDRIVAHPFDRQLDHAGRLAVAAAARSNPRRPSARNRRAGPSPSRCASVLGLKSQDGVRMPTGRLPVIFSSVSADAQHQVALGLVRQHGVELVDPAMDADLVALGDDARAARRDGAARRRPARRSVAVTSCFSSSSRMRGTPTRLPYWPQDMRPIDLPPSRSSLVSWSESKESATAQRAPSFQALGRQRPAGAHLVHQRAPVLLAPLPRFQLRNSVYRA